MIAGVGVTMISVGSYVSSFNSAVRLESSLVASRENNENILAQYGLKIAEMTQVPQMYKDDLVAVVKEAIGGRYGKDGSKAVFQMLKEQNPNLDPQLYRTIQSAIEGGRNDFTNGQTKMLDIKRTYETELNSFFTGTMMRMAGFPKIDMKEFKIVSSSVAQEAYKTGIDKPLKLR